MRDFDLSAILGAVGINTEIMQAIAAAELDPTSANVNAVVAAYAKVGMVIPSQLYAHLLQINEERHPEDTVRGAVAPWLIAGAAILAFILFMRR